MPHRNIRVLTWFNFFTDFKLYAPVAIIYFAHVTGSFALGMSIFSIATVASAIFEVPTGILSDKIGRRKTLIFGAATAVLYSIFYAIGQSYWILALGAVLEGLSRSFYSGNNDALLHDTLSEIGKKHEYDEYLGKVSTMFQIALAASAIIGSIMASWSFAVIMWVSVIPQIVCLILGSTITEPKHVSGENGNVFRYLKNALTRYALNEKLRLLSFSSVLSYGLGESGYLFQSAFYQTLWPVWAIGIVKAISNIGAAVSFHYSGNLIRRFGAIRLFVVENIYNRLIKVIAILIPTPLSPILFSTTSFFYGVTEVARGSLLQKEFTDTERATMGSLDSLAGSIFFAVAAYSLGKLADMTSVGTAFLILQVLQLLSLFIFWRLFKLGVGRKRTAIEK